MCSLKAVVVRTGGTRAVLVLPEIESLRLEVPSALLRAACSEGDILTISLERDETATQEARDRAVRLIGDLVRA